MGSADDRRQHATRALDASRIGFQIISPEWRYVYVNPAAAAQGQRRPAELEGRTMMEMYPGIDRTPLFAALRESMIHRTGRIFENEFAFPDGETRWFEVRLEPVEEGICIYSIDIHDRKQRELELVRRAENLSPAKAPWWRRLVSRG